MRKIATGLLCSSLVLAMSAGYAAEADLHLEYQTQSFVNELNSGNGKPIEKLPPEEARNVLSGAQSSVKVDLSGVSTTQKTIQVAGKPVELTIARPENASETLPAFMFFHGGGWVLGDFPTHQRMVRDLVLASGAAAVFVNYTPSPEAHYPVAINQAYGATKWVAEHGAEINIDGKRLAVAGNSVGGNMAAAVSLMAKEKQGPALRYQVLFWPVTDAKFDTESYGKYAEKRFLTRNMMKWFWDNYTTDSAQRNEIYASPLRATEAQLKGLPPALVQTAENDVLRDEGEAYARKLNAAGVDVVQVRYNGMIHDYGLLNALAEVPEVQASLTQAGHLLQEHLK